MLAWTIQKYNLVNEDLMLFENLDVISGARRNPTAAKTNGFASTFAGSV